MISQFFELGDNKIALSILIALSLLIILLLISMRSKSVESWLKKVKILEDKESPKEMLLWVIGILLAVRIIHVFMVQPFMVDGDSMYPNLHSNEILLVDKISYRLASPAIGDIIVFKYHDPYHKCLDNLQSKELCRTYTQDPYDGKYLVKRIIALPNSTTTYDGRTLITKQNQYIVMGDNRDESYDSRAWGPLDERYISGKVFLRLLPVSKFGLNPSPMSDPINLK